MNRRWLPLFASVVILTGMVVFADEPPPDQGEPPIRLKKKNKPNDPAKPPEVENKKDDKKDDKKNPDKPEAMPDKDGDPFNDEDEKEVLERIARNMKASEDKIANKELDDGTRQTQEDIIKDLESLIKMSENGGGEDNQDQQNQAEQNKGGQQQKQQASRNRQQRNQRMAGRQQQRNGQQQQANARPQGQQNPGQNPMGQGDQQANNKQPGNNGNNPGAGNNGEPGRLNKDADQFKDAWGHLPEALRAQMTAYASREKYMDKHQELIKQYYRTIAAQGAAKNR